MSHLRFNQVFLSLMALSVISAFMVPPRWTDLGRVQLEGLFIPVSRPAYQLATWARGKVVHEDEPDPRSRAAIEQENTALRQEVTRLQVEIQRLEGLASERESLGDLNRLCERFAVAGTDSGNTDGLLIGGSLLHNVKDGQPVLYSGGIAGRIDRAGVNAAHVRLVSDPRSVVTGQFIRFVRAADGVRVQAVRVSTLRPIVHGAGGGQMVISIEKQPVTDAGVRPDDWVVLIDDQWPQAVQGVRVGRVASIAPQKKNPLFAEIRLVPETGLMRLSDVWVMTEPGKEGGK